MKKTGLPGNFGVVEAFERRASKETYLYLYYAYGEVIPSDINPSQGQRTEFVIGGKRAVVYVWQYDKNEILIDKKLIPGMELIVPYAGDKKNKFEIYAVSFDLDIIKQIIDSVEIR